MPYKAATRWPTSMGNWVVDGYPMVGQHQKILDLEKLWFSNQVVGENEDQAGQAGKLARYWKPDEKVVQLKLQMGGKYDYTGAEWPSNIEGLEGNLEALYAVATPPRYRDTPVDAKTVTSVLTRPSGISGTAEITLEASEPEREGGGLLRLVLTVRIPAVGHIWVP